MTLIPDTRNEARADALESRKRELDAQIADIRAVMRELPIEYDSKAYALYVSLDREIDALLVKKDNLPDVLFREWAEADHADWQDEMQTRESVRP